MFTLDSRGQEPRAYWGGYAVTKAGVATLARELADEWEKRDNLRVNAVVPGPIRSPLRGQTHPGRRPHAAAGAGIAGAALSLPHRRTAEERERRAASTLRPGSAARPASARCARSARGRAGGGSRPAAACPAARTRARANRQPSPRGRQTSVVKRAPTYVDGRTRPRDVRPSAVVSDSMRSPSRRRRHAAARPA